MMKSLLLTIHCIEGSLIRLILLPDSFEEVCKVVISVAVQPLVRSARHSQRVLNYVFEIGIMICT